MTKPLLAIGLLASYGAVAAPQDPSNTPVSISWWVSFRKDAYVINLELVGLFFVCLQRQHEHPEDQQCPQMASHHRNFTAVPFATMNNIDFPPPLNSE